MKGVYERVRNSGVWWIRYADKSGRIRREKAGQKAAAMTLYRKRKTETLEGKKLPENLRTIVRISDIAPALLRDYRINKKKSYKTLQYRLNKHILPFFGAFPADELGTDEINRYIDNRTSAGAEGGTINRELAGIAEGAGMAGPLASA